MSAAGPFKTTARLILASASPRRRELLQSVGLDFEIIEAGVTEQPEAGETPEEFALRAACDKADVVSRKHADAWVMGADTVVVQGDRMLGKPTGPEDALEILQSLAGRSHQVHTGFCLQNSSEQTVVSRVVTTRVNFFRFSREIAAAYVATGEPLDKAGAYGIQGCGGFLVKSISGSYSNVVGLPLAEVIQELLHYRVISLRQG